MTSPNPYKIVWMVSLLVACETLPDEPVTLPAVLDSLFAICEPTDGALDFQLREGEGVVLRTELEWATNDAGWVAEALDPLGQTQIRVLRKGDAVAVQGPAAEKVPPIAISSEGRLLIDGHEVGLRADEVPCLFAHKLPRSWQAALVRVDFSYGYSLAFTDGWRHIEVDHNEKKTCTAIRWGGFLGIGRRQLDWCIDRREKSAELDSGLEGSLYWKTLDGE